MKRVTKADLLKRNAELSERIIELVMRPDSTISDFIRMQVKYSVTTELAIMFGEPCSSSKGIINQITTKNT